MSKRAQVLVLVVATVIAAPVALAFETLLRTLLFPPDFELVRLFLEPVMTPIAWLLVAIATTAGIAGVLLQPRLVARKLARFGGHATSAQRETALNQVFMLTASIPQIPTIASTFAFMFGASLVPTLVGVAICTISVLAQGLALRAAASKGSP